jgi:hypothetical protein
MDTLLRTTHINLARDHLAKAYDLPVEALTPEMFDFLRIVSNGAKKYAMNNWLDPDGHSVSHEDMYNKMFRHLARGFANFELLDNESKEHHLLHVMCRAAMMYTRDVRNIRHSNDTAEGLSRGSNE